MTIRRSQSHLPVLFAIVASGTQADNCANRIFAPRAETAAIYTKNLVVSIS
jgi:hypothetical protein